MDSIDIAYMEQNLEFFQVPDIQYIDISRAKSSNLISTFHSFEINDDKNCLKNSVFRDSKKCLLNIA